MPTQESKAKGSPWLFSRTSNDVVSIVDTAEFFDVVDTMAITLPKKCLLTITYNLEVEIPSPAENASLYKQLFILCTLNPTSTDLLNGGIDCSPNGGAVFGEARGVPFGDNFGLTTQRHHGNHGFTWVENVNAGAHKVVMRATYRISLIGGPPNPPPTVITNPKILKRTLLIRATPN